MSYKVYKHTCPNGKSYIGITKQDPKMRWNYGNGYATQLFGRAVKKYGWANIKHEILEICETLSDANACEVKYIAMYETTNPEKGYNCTIGGDGTSGHLVSDKTREISRRTANRLWADPEMREHLLNHLREIANSNRGKKRTEAEKRKTALANGKAVDQYTMSGEYVATHLTMMDAARSCSKNDCSSIVGVCKGKLLEAHGYIWRYHGEPLDYEGYLKRKKAWKDEAADRFRKCAEMNQKPVVLLDEDGNVEKWFESAKIGATETGTPYSSLLLCCKGKVHRANGRKWAYA